MIDIQDDIYRIVSDEIREPAREAHRENLDYYAATKVIDIMIDMVWRYNRYALLEPMQNAVKSKLLP